MMIKRLSKKLGKYCSKSKLCFVVTKARMHRLNLSRVLDLACILLAEMPQNCHIFFNVADGENYQIMANHNINYK